jgi:predicted RNA binding protein YcfA (HicA-like mRNA interferase family)
MPKLPHLSGREIIRVLERLGFRRFARTAAMW